MTDDEWPRFFHSEFLFLAKVMHTIPFGTVYTVWTGIGAIGTAVVGVYFFDDRLSLSRSFSLTLLVKPMVGLKLVSH